MGKAELEEDGGEVMDMDIDGGTNPTETEIVGGKIEPNLDNFNDPGLVNDQDI